MKFINECVNDLSVGVLAQFNDAGLIAQRSNGRLLGIVTRVFTTNIEDDQGNASTVNIAEITTQGSCNNAILSGSATWQGCNLYASSDGSRLSSTVNGDVLAVLMPRFFGDAKTDFVNDELVTVVIK